MSTTTLPRPPIVAPPPTGREPQPPGRLRTLVRGRADDPSWARPLLTALLVATAAGYLVDLTASGYANSFYAAAVQAGTESWKAFFFGSIDKANFITVDKPPASLWVMELSGRIFGFSSASMLAPEVLEGVISVGLLYAAVKRWFGAGAGLLAGLILAITPVAALMFRFNNPDALLVCLLVAAAYCLVRATERGSLRWMIAVGSLLGFAFLAKMLQAFLVVPGFALVYLVAAPVDVKRRVGHLLAGGAAMLASAGWWVAIVALWPAASRPMIDGSPDNSIINLIFGYNGLGRLTGSGGGGGGGGNFSGATGLFRLFDSEMGAQASWLIPAALIVLVAGLIWRGRAARTDRWRAGLLLWGSWLIVTAIIFSFGQGVIHTYYTVALAPAIAALCGIGAAQLWREREHVVARVIAAGLVAITAGWAVALLGRDSGWQPWLTPLVIVCAVFAIVGLALPDVLRRRVSALVAVAAATACLAAPFAYAVQTIGTAHTGSTPSAGPAGTGMGGPGGFRGGGPEAADGSASTRFGGGSGSGGFGAASRSGLRGSGASAGTRGSGGMGGSVSSALVTLLESGTTGYRWVAATDGSQSAASLELATNGTAVMAIGGFSGEGGNLSLAQFEKYVKAGDIHYYVASSGGAGGFGGAATTGGSSGDTAGGASGLESLFGGSVSASSSTAEGAGGGPSSTAEGAAGAPTAGTSGAPSGGTGGSASGGSGAPTGADGGMPTGTRGGGPGGSQTSSQILAWVKAHYTAKTVGGETVYDLSSPK